MLPLHDDIPSQRYPVITARPIVLKVAASMGTVALLSYWIFWLTVRGAHRLSPPTLKVVTRLIGLLLAAVAVPFALSDLSQTTLFAR